MLKRTCAKEALKYIKNNSVIGLGGGTTISYLVSYIKEADLNVQIVTPSLKTEKLCIENGLKVLPAWTVDSISSAFDGCDEVDYNLNALKSGGGIHTTEKIIASMADDYILLVDESKVSKKLDFKYPVVLEIIPESLGIVEKSVRKLGGKPVMRSSSAKDGFIRSDHGLFLMDVEFKGEDIKDVSVLNNELKKIIGIVETSLFFNIATKVIIASQNGIKTIENER